MMNYEIFVEELKNEISAAISIPRENISFEKEGGRFAPVGDRLLVKFAEHDDAWEVCGLYTQELFKSYEEGDTFANILAKVIEDILRIKDANVYDQTKGLRDYEVAKKRLFVRLLNKDKNAADLQDTIHKIVGDIALVTYAQVSEQEGCVTSTKIRKAMLEHWKKDHPELNEDNLFKEAIDNTYRMTPPRLYKWEKMIFDPSYNGDDFMSPNRECEISAGYMGNCISTTIKTNGAIAIFLPGVTEKLADLLDSDLYLVFTSIHEVMVHKADEVDPEDLKSVLKDTLEEATPKEDFLTSKIYMYEKDTHNVICIG